MNRRSLCVPPTALAVALCASAALRAPATAALCVGAFADGAGESPQPLCSSDRACRRAVRTSEGSVCGFIPWCLAFAMRSLMCVRLITSCAHVRSLVLAMRSRSRFILLMRPGSVLAMRSYACADASCTQRMALSGSQGWLSALALSAGSQRWLSALALSAWPQRVASACVSQRWLSSRGSHDDGTATTRRRTTMTTKTTKTTTKTTTNDDDDDDD